MRLADSNLLRQQGYIDGRWTDGESGSRYSVRNPTSGAIIGTLPEMGAEDTRRAIEAAAAAFPAWAARTAKDRAGILRLWFELILAHQEDLACILTSEQGKPLAEARGEIVYAASFVEWFSEEGKRLYGDVIPSHQADKRLLVLRQPVGVVAAITPWNFPAAMLTRKAAPALAAGCTVVCKPAHQTPYTALALAMLAERAGVPRGVLNVITGEDVVEIGRELTANRLVRKVTFTGSTRVGKLLMQQCAPTLKKLSLELGGNAPFIVFDDADLDAAVAGALASRFRNSGQTCVCANRFLVHASVCDEFSRRFADAVSALRVGDGMSAETDQGPLIDERAVVRIERLLADATAGGARVLCGGARHRLGGTFFEPTVVTDVTAEMAIVREEIFGPVAPIMRFDTEADAIRMANSTELGLAAYCYTRDLSRSWRVMESLEYGIVGLNTGLVSTEVAPFGGVKESGFGREGSRHGMLDYTELKYVCVGGIA